MTPQHAIDMKTFWIFLFFASTVRRGIDSGQSDEWKTESRLGEPDSYVFGNGLVPGSNDGYDRG